MDEDHKRKKTHRMSLIDRLQKFSGGDPVIDKNKFNRIRKKLTEPHKIDEGYDSWMDDTEEEHDPMKGGMSKRVLMEVRNGKETG